MFEIVEINKKLVIFLDQSATADAIQEDCHERPNGFVLFLTQTPIKKDAEGFVKYMEFLGFENMRIDEITEHGKIIYRPRGIYPHRTEGGLPL